MGRIEELADCYSQHIATPWQRTIAGAQRVVMVVYDKERERTLRARLVAFETATRRTLVAQTRGLDQLQRATGKAAQKPCCMPSCICLISLFT